MAKSYYQQIQGKKFKRSLIDMAKSCVSGKGDGRISLDDAKVLFKKAHDGSSYTQVEKDTIKYIRDNFNWTDQADGFFRKETRRIAVTRGLMNRTLKKLGHKGPRVTVRKLAKAC
ncbi:MAG: hypothetical protein P1V97_00710 [Planctomycetota bacterium]|nr:hypothetical protein [Planctomycetota bacterium]